MKIACWLKIMKRDKFSMDFIYNNLDFWLKVFDREKYEIYIYNENIEELSDKYTKYKIVNKKDVVEKYEKLYDEIVNSKIINNKWKNAAFALAAPYFYLEDELVWQIDADDIILEGKTNYYIDRVEDELKNLPVLSSDIYFSVPNNSWSFGITYANRKRFREIVEKALKLNTFECGWGRNLDHQIDQYFKLVERFEYISFTTPDRFIHEGKDGLKSYFDIGKNLSACDLYGKRIQYGRKNNRSLLIK
jgi:hypothetical protein